MVQIVVATGGMGGDGGWGVVCAHGGCWGVAAATTLWLRFLESPLPQTLSQPLMSTLM